MQLSSYQGDKPYVFISYSHRDTDRVYRILEHMKRVICCILFLS